MISKLVILAFWFACALCACAQSATGLGTGYMRHAAINRTSDGNLEIAANSAQPMLQALTAIRRQYGWIIDYEEGKHTPGEIFVDRDGKMRPRGGSFRVRVAPPAQGPGADPSMFLQAFTDAVGNALGREFIVQATASQRFNVVTHQQNEIPLLDTPILLPRATRTIDQTVENILGLVSHRRKVSLNRGGLIDQELLQKTVTVGSDTEELPARDLLTQALDAADIARVWSLGYEPSGGNFYIGIELAVRAETMATGEVKVFPVPSSSKPDSGR